MRRYFQIFLVVFCSFHICFGTVKRVEINSIRDTKGYYAGIIDISVGGGFYPLEALLLFETPYPIFEGTNPFILDYKFTSEKIKKKFSFEDHYYYVIVYGKLNYTSKRMAFGTLSIDKIIFSIRVSSDFVKCLCKQKTSEQRLNYYRKNPLKLLSFCKNIRQKTNFKNEQFDFSQNEDCLPPIFNTSLKNNIKDAVFCGILDSNKYILFPIEKILINKLPEKCLQETENCNIGVPLVWEKISNYNVFDKQKSSFFLVIFKGDYYTDQAFNLSIYEAKKILFAKPLDRNQVKYLLKTKVSPGKLRYYLDKPYNILKLIK